MRKPLSKDLVEKLRDEIRNGKSRTQVARDNKLSYATVLRYTRDIPAPPPPRKYPVGTKEKIRKMVTELGQKVEVARRLGVPIKYVQKVTRDIKVGQVISFGKKTMMVMNELFENGYVYLEGWKTSKIRLLRRYFPFIKIATVKNRVAMAFLPDRTEEAMRAMVEKMDKRIWTYQELRAVTKLFDSDLDDKEKRGLVKKEAQVDTVFLVKQSQKGFIGKSQTRKQSKIQLKIEDFPDENPISLAFFYIRNN